MDKVTLTRKYQYNFDTYRRETIFCHLHSKASMVFTASQICLRDDRDSLYPKRPLTNILCDTIYFGSFPNYYNTKVCMQNNLVIKQAMMEISSFYRSYWSKYFSTLPSEYHLGCVFQEIDRHEHIETAGSSAQPGVDSQMNPYRHHTPPWNIWFDLQSVVARP